MSKANSKDKGLNKLNLEIKYLPINQIYPYDNNPRKNDKGVKPLMESIKKFGFSFPITIDKENVIISGHTRYKAALKLKLKEVPCVRREDLTDEQDKALRLVDNQISSISEWDFGKREDEFKKITSIDLTCLGFEKSTDEFINDMLENEFKSQSPVLDVFEMTLLFPKTEKDDIDAYITACGKEGFVKAILEKVIGGGVLTDA